MSLSNFFVSGAGVTTWVGSRRACALGSGLTVGGRWRLLGVSSSVGASVSRLTSATVAPIRLGLALGSRGTLGSTRWRRSSVSLSKVLLSRGNVLRSGKGSVRATAGLTSSRSPGTVGGKSGMVASCRFWSSRMRSEPDFSSGGLVTSVGSRFSLAFSTASMPPGGPRMPCCGSGMPKASSPPARFWAPISAAPAAETSSCRASSRMSASAALTFCTALFICASCPVPEGAICPMLGSLLLTSGS